MTQIELFETIVELQKQIIELQKAEITRLKQTPTWTYCSAAPEEPKPFKTWYDGNTNKVEC
jgi:hypothetical protein